MKLPPAAALQLVPGLEGGEAPLRCVALTGGSVNFAWRVTSAAGDFVVRVDGPAWRRPGVDRQRERILHRLAARAGIAPDIVAASPSSDVLVTAFVAGEPWTSASFADARRLRLLGERLHQLHALAVPAGVAAFDAAGLGRQYLAAGIERREQARQAGQAEQVLSQLLHHCALLGPGVAPSIVHGDPTHANLIGSAPLWLIDWEYAQVAPPILDVAAVLAYYPQAQRFQADLLAAAGQAGAQADRERLAAAMGVHLALGWLWRHARGEPPGAATGALPSLSAN